MIRANRLALLAFAFGFGTYHAVLGVIYLANYEQTSPAVVAVGLYLFALFRSLLSGPGLRISSFQAWANLFTALAVPLLMAQAIRSDLSFGYSTWHVAGIATLMGITAIRGFPVAAWLGAVALVVEVFIWGGPGVIYSSGIIGAVLLVLASQGASYAISASTRAARDFELQSYATQAASLELSAAARERKNRLQQAISAAVPVLQKIVQSNGELGHDLRSEVVLTEAALRDQIRGRELITTELSNAISSARKRGVEVQLHDDGGLERLSRAEKNELISKAATTLDQVQSGKVVIRSVSGESWRISITALSQDDSEPSLFLRI